MLDFNFKYYSSKKFIQLLCILSINILLINTYLIGEKKPLTKSEQEFKTELRIIQDTPWSFNNIDYKTYDYEDPGLGKITFSKFILNFSYFNIDKLQINVDNDNNYILEDTKSDTFKNVFFFEYQAGEKQNKGEFTISTSSMKFSKKFSTEDYKIKQDVKLELNWNLVSIVLSDESIKTLIQNGLIDFLQKKGSVLIKQSLENDIKIFYDNLNKINSEINNLLNITCYTPSIDLQINVAYDQLPQFNSLNNITIFGRNGQVNDIPHNVTELPKFVYQNYSSSLEVAISRYFFTDIISLMTKDGLFDYSINSYNLYPDSSFDLTIDFLSNIIPEVTDSYSRNQRLTVYNYVKDIVFDQVNKDKFIFNALVETQIKEKLFEDTLFKYTHNISIELKPIISGTNLNFYFDSINMQWLKVISNEYSYVNISVLKNYLIGYYDLYFRKNKKFYLFLTPIDMRNYGTTIKASTFTEYGFNLLFDSNFVKYFMKNEIREKALKFLGGH